MRHWPAPLLSLLLLAACSSGPTFSISVTSLGPASPTTAEAQDGLSVEWIYGSGPGAIESLPRTQWTDSGKLILFDGRRPAAERVFEVLDPQTGDRQPAVDRNAALASLKALVPDTTGLTWPTAWNPQGTRAAWILQGDLFVLDLPSASFVRLTSTPEAEQSPLFSPDGRRLAFVRANDLYSADLRRGQEHRLTADGSEVIKNGTLSWVYWEEVYGRRDMGFWWSPDSTRIAFLRSDESAVATSRFVHYRPWTPTVLEQRYPKAGTVNPTVQVGIAAANGEGTIWLDTSGPEHEYVLRVNWHPAGDRLAVQLMNRAQTLVDLLLYPAGGGAPRNLLRETDPGWVNHHDDLVFLENDQFLWQSERTGYAHLYRVSDIGDLANAVTAGDWAVRASSGVFWLRQTIQALDEAQEWLYFTSLEKSSIERHLYRVRLDGSERTRLSQEDGTHVVTFSPDARFYLDAHSDATTPASLRLHRADGSLVQVLAEPDRPALAALDLQMPEFFTVPTRDGFAMPASVIKPQDFDESRPYPVILYVYGGPSAPTVADAWGGRNFYFDQLLVRDGYVVVRVDNRSATAISKTLENGILHQMYGPCELNDLTDAVGWLKDQAWVDDDRVGIWGWSGGGTFTLLAMTHTQEFKAGIAVAAVTDWRYYDTKWAEASMKTPAENPEGYAAFDLNARAKDLSGRLLLVHGTHDDNVHPANAWQFVESLVQAGKSFDMMFYPMRKHGIADPAARIHLFRKMREFWRRRL